MNRIPEFEHNNTYQHFSLDEVEYGQRVVEDKGSFLQGFYGINFDIDEDRKNIIDQKAYYSDSIL